MDPITFVSYGGLSSGGPTLLQSISDCRHPFALSTFEGDVVVEGNTTMTLPTYADNSSAVTGGLSVGTVYKTATGEVRVVV